MSELLGAAFVLLFLMGLLDLIVRPAPRVVGGVSFLGAGVASVLLVVIGAAAITGASVRLDLGSLLGAGPLSLGASVATVDRLSGLFLVITFGVAAPASVVCAAWVLRTPRERVRRLGALHCLVFGALVIVLTATNAFPFLLGWELLTIAFYLLAGYERDGEDRAGAAIVTVALGKLSGAALLVGFLLLAAQTGGVDFAQLATAPRTGTRDVACALLVAGFAVKVGLVPFHVWMPRGYTAAPGPLRAVMAGVAVNVGFYGMWRTLQLVGVPPGWLTIAVLLLGGITALLGIAHATVATDLAGVVAYSSIENAGLISVGFGVALVGAAVAQPQLLAAGLLAATLQTITHAMAKTLLFGATATVEDATGTRDLEALRGIGHRLPIGGAGIAVGALTLAGLPLTAGLVSEWFLLEALMQEFRLGRLDSMVPMAVAGALVALTAGFAAVAFVRLVGLIVLGPRDEEDTHTDGDVGLLGGVGLATLGIGCLGVAAVAPLVIRAVAAGLDPVVGHQVTSAALQGPWVLGPVFADFSALSPSALAVVMPLLLLAVVLLSLALGRRRLFTVRRVPAWRSATGGVAGENQYTPFGFANPTRKVLASLLLTRSELVVLEKESGGQVDDPDHGAAGAHLGYTSDVVEVVEQMLLRPVGRALLAVARAIKTLQNGRLDTYLGYMLLALLAVLAVVAGTV